MSQNNGGRANDRQQGTNANAQQTAGGQQNQAAGTGQQAGQQATGGQQTGRQGRGSGRSLSDWFASGVVRGGIILVGFLLFLFAIGQAVGLGLLDMFVSAVTSQTGRWLVVAGFALLLIFVGQQGVKHSSLYD